MANDRTPAQDLSHLAWVFDELRQSLQGAHLALQRFAIDHRHARQTDLASVDTADLRMARQQLHQAVGALEMVGLSPAARVLRAMEAAVQRFTAKPDACTPEAVATLERCGFALAEHLQRVLRQRPLPDLALYPAYRDAQALAGAERMHPADLWQAPARGAPLPRAQGVAALTPEPAVRAQIDRHMLAVVKTLDPGAAAALARLAAGLSAGAPQAALAGFWCLAAAGFEAMAQGLLPADLHVKRLVSRVLMQYGKPEVPDALQHELLFFCAQARPAPGTCPQLEAVRASQGLADSEPFDYERPRLGQFDPTALDEALRRVRAASEAMSSDAHAALPDRVGQVAASLRRLLPVAEPLALALEAVAATPRPADTAARAAIGMELATALLLLEATFDAFDPENGEQLARAAQQASRLRAALAGQPAAPLEPWMEQLYRHSSERHNLGSVVGEARHTLADVEKALDQWAREHTPPASLGAATDRLRQLRGVFSVLGVETASHTVQALADGVETLLRGPAGAAAQDAEWQRLGHNLSALGFLVDVLALQPALARDGFAFDGTAGRLLPLMAALPEPVAAPADAAPAPPPEPPAVEPADDEAELLGIFFDEAREVLGNAGRAVEALRAAPASLGDLTALRRAFHTLKGSSRMVDLRDFGEAAWAMEQLLNARLAEQAPADDALLVLSSQALAAFADWVGALAVGTPPPWTAEPFQRSAQALRDGAAVVPFGSEPVPEPEPEPEPAFDGFDEQVKVVGPLRIGLKLFNVYLNEADEWSRRLCVALGEWALQRGEAPPPDAVVWAHSLGGSSATVGFESLSTLARALEAALERTPPRVDADAAPLLVQAAEEIRHLLHQFAAGFLKEASADTLERLALWPPAAPEPVVVPAPAGDAAAIEAVDTLDRDLFQIFADEAQDLLPRLGGALRQWTARPDNTSARAEVLRNLHTLKGSARLAGAMRLGEMAHRMETQAEAEGVSPDALLAAFDALAARFEQLRHADAPAPGVMLASVEALASAPPAPPPEPETGIRLPEAPQPLAGARASASAVRVRPELLDQLMGHTGEIMLSRARMDNEMRTLRSALQDMTVNLARLRQQLRDLELQSESQLQSRQAQSQQPGGDADFDPLEFDRFTRVQELTRMMAETVNDIAMVQRILQRAVDVTEDGLAAQARQSRELQRDLLDTRMVEFDAVAERLYRVVRQAAKETGKQVRLDISGAHIEMDRGVMERMTPAFEHLLRNAVVHGIEPPEARLAAGKPAEGEIALALGHEGSDITVSLSDDGAGLDLPRIIEKARAQGLLPAGEPAQAQDLVFEPGLSTAAQVTELAGRGVGLDVVRSDVLALGGRIEVQSRPGQGTRFTLVLPLTTAITQVVLLRAGEHTFGVPASLIERVWRLEPAALAAARQGDALVLEGETLPFFPAHALLQRPAAPATDAHTVPVLQLRSATQRLALQVDEVLGNQEVVVKHLGPQLSRLPGVAGMTVLASGAVAVIYNPVALAAVHGVQARAWAAGGTAGAGPRDGQRAPLVMVVDDSITVRRVTQRLLQREGYRVVLANDGEQALERLKGEKPAVVLTDIEMPRMDGFDLVRHMRADLSLADLPVVMITSRIADKHRQLARELGVDHYLGKPYAEDELLALVAGYARAAALTTA